MKHMIEEKVALQFCEDLSEKNVNRGIQGRAYNYSFAYGVIFSAGKNCRGVSRYGRRETLQVRRGGTDLQNSITELEEEWSIQLSKLQL